MNRMNVMKTCSLLLAALLAASSVTAVAPPPVVIKATKKTADVQRDSERLSARATMTHETKEQYYLIELGTMTRGLPDYVVVRWIVLLEDFKGRLVVGTRGSKDVPLAVNKTAEVQTDRFTLVENTLVKTHNRGGGRESTIRGYGIRVCDDAGRILAEKYDPPSAEKDLVAAFDEKAERRRD